ncbi:hypothetical protein [Actinoplanes sp. NPDC051494]|uniref:hypothetical protein n=1 Tax=Actinoplanes sp. NPDC051494 TaxID=3363907 RepID=UPI0037904202
MITLRKAFLVAALLLSPLFVLTGPSPASAATGSCDGTLIDSAPIKAGGSTYGTLYVYYNSSTGKNCAKATNTTGARRSMTLWLFRCAAGTGSTYASCDPIDTPDQDVNFDADDYISYAGPIHNKGTSAGRCIYTGVDMVVGNTVPKARIGGHCG